MDYHNLTNQRLQTEQYLFWFMNCDIKLSFERGPNGLLRDSSKLRNHPQYSTILSMEKYFIHMNPITELEATFHFNKHLTWNNNDLRFLIMFLEGKPINNGNKPSVLIREALVNLRNFRIAENVQKGWNVMSELGYLREEYKRGWLISYLESRSLELNQRTYDEDFVYEVLKESC